MENLLATTCASYSSGQIVTGVLLLFSADYKQFHKFLSRSPTWNISNQTHPFNGPFSGTSGESEPIKPIWILLKQETVSGSGISWAICKSAPRSRQITMPAPHLSFFTGRMLFLPPNQQCQSTEGRIMLSSSCANSFAFSTMLKIFTYFYVTKQLANTLKKLKTGSK